MQALGWAGRDDHPGFVMPAIPTPPPPPRELRIRRVATAADLEAWFEAASPGARGPDDPPSVDCNRLFIRSLAVALDPAIALVTGFLDGGPVASSALSIVDGVAEISAVATRPDVRWRGYGTALTWAAIAEGAERGPAAALRASAMAVPLYRAMGFHPVGAFRAYAAPAS